MSQPASAGGATVSASTRCSAPPIISLTLLNIIDKIIFKYDFIAHKDDLLMPEAPEVNNDIRIKRRDILENLMYLTVRIETNIKCGTGFICQITVAENITQQVIVTNRHVLYDAESFKIGFHKGDDKNIPLKNGGRITITCETLSHIIPHPNPAIDLCIIPINDLIVQQRSKRQYIGYSSWPMENFPDSGITDIRDISSPMEDIVMIGYPNGIYDEHNFMPIIRKGVTATHPNMNYMNRPEFLIDAHCWPGSSGSPVFYFQDYSVAIDDAKIAVVCKPSVLLLGILYTSPSPSIINAYCLSSDGSSEVSDFFCAIPNGLGCAIKSNQLNDFITYYKILYETQKLSH